MTTEGFRTVDRCVDTPIAGAISAETRPTVEPHFACLVHEIRNHLNTAELALRLVETGDAVSEVSIAVLQRSLIGLRQLVDTALLDARMSHVGIDSQVVPLDPLLAGLGAAAQLAASAQRCSFVCGPVASGLAVRADPRLLHSAIWNLLQNAFKFTHLGTSVTLSSVVHDDMVRIAVTDECGGLPPASPGSSPTVFEQRSPDRSGLGLGLAIARRAVEACGGKLLVADSPGKGCTFAIEIAAWPAPPSTT